MSVPSLCCGCLHLKLGIFFCIAPVLCLLCFLLLETDSIVAQAGLEPPVRLRMSSVSEFHC